MFHPVKMSKVRAICLKASAPSVIRALHNLSVLHIKDAELPETERAGPLPSFDDVSARHVKIRALLEALPKSGRQPRKKTEIANALREADGLLAASENFYPLLKEKEEIQKGIEAIRAMQKAVSEIAGLRIDFPSLSSESLQFVLLKASADKASSAQKALAKRKNCALLCAQSGAAFVLLAALPKKEDAKFLEQFGVAMPIPRLSSTPQTELASLRAQEGSLLEKLASVERKISRFADSNYFRLLAAEEALSIESERSRISTMFGATDSLYYIEGWAEASRLEWLKAEMRRRFGKKVLVSEARIGHEELPPTLLSNPKMAGPFQFVVEFLSTTGYREIDPSLILFITIPLMYALIFGDAGYAVFSFLMASFMVKKSKKGSLLNQVATIWAISAIPAFLMGVIFDEYFGFTHERLLSLFGMHGVQLYQGMHRISSITTLMFITILVGMAHLGLGFMLGAVNEWEHSRKHAIAKLCWLGVEISGFFLVASFMFSAFPALSLPALALLVLSVAGMVITEGPIAAIEIPGLASNIMSYIRIAAVGVSGAILAEAINELLLPRFEASPLGVIFFIITFAIYMSVHALSCLLAMFESFVHGARLNVVEFFGKFYKGNGIRFAPFASRRLYSQEAA